MSHTRTTDPPLSDHAACGNTAENVTDLSIPTGTDEMCRAYSTLLDRAIELKSDLLDTMHELNQVFAGGFGVKVELCGVEQPYDFNRDKHDQNIRKEAKRIAWRVLIGKLELEKVMSAKKKDEMRQALDANYRSRSHSAGKDPIDDFPEITPETVFDVLSAYVLSAEDFLLESIQEIYDWLKPGKWDSYKTNQQNRWKIGEKIIISYAVEADYSGGFRLRYGSVDTKLTTMDSIFHQLDGKGFPKSHVGPLADTIKSIKTTNQWHDTDYFSVKVFKNGNLHLAFLRPDLVEEFNYRCGSSDQLPGRDSDPYDSGKRDSDNPKRPVPGQGGDFELFETPVALAEQMVAAANIKPGSLVYEPSAGKGRIARAARSAGAVVLCNEIQHDLAETLRQDGFECTTFDFLNPTSSPAPIYDAVLLNPPFSRFQDTWHIQEAFRWLSQNGTLVAIASKGVTFRKDRQTMQFRRWLDTHNAVVSDLPTDTFKESGTRVETVLIVIDKAKQSSVTTCNLPSVAL